jgi:hypothetical protein
MPIERLRTRTDRPDTTLLMVGEDGEHTRLRCQCSPGGLLAQPAPHEHRHAPALASQRPETGDR